MRAVWEALKLDGSFIAGDWAVKCLFLSTVLREEGEASWTRLWQILDHSTEDGATQMGPDGGRDPDGGMDLGGGKAAQIDEQR